MRIAICNENKDEMIELKETISRYIDENMLNIQIDCYENSDMLLKGTLEINYNIIYQNLSNNSDKNINIIKKIKENNKDIIIIFTSNSKDYMEEGYKIGVVHYLLNPVNDYDVIDSLKRAFRVSGKKWKHIEVTVDRVEIVVYLKNILYVEIYKNTCIIHEINRKLKTYSTLNEIQDKIDDKHFIRCHKSYLVNIEAVIDIKDYDLLVKNGDSVPMRKNDKKEIVDTINSYLKEKIIE